MSFASALTEPWSTIRIPFIACKMERGSALD